jgi:hypothetical protein
MPFLTRLTLTLLLLIVPVWQGTKRGSPFDKYRQSTVNELEFRKLQFQVEAVRLSLQPAPMPVGIGVPHIVGERSDGKLLVEVEVYASDLPQSIEARRDAMMEATNRAGAASSFAFYKTDSGALPDEFFRRWFVVRFFDTEKFTKTKDKMPIDPYIGTYENGELVLR